MLTKNHMKSFSPVSCFFGVRLRRKRHQTSVLGLSLFFISYFLLFCFQNCWEVRSDMIWSDLLWLELDLTCWLWLDIFGCCRSTAQFVVKNSFLEFCPQGKRHPRSLVNHLRAEVGGGTSRCTLVRSQRHQEWIWTSWSARPALRDSLKCFLAIPKTLYKRSTFTRKHICLLSCKLLNQFQFIVRNTDMWYE